MRLFETNLLRMIAAPPRCRKRFLEVWTGTQAEYAALTPDPDTLYLIP